MNRHGAMKTTKILFLISLWAVLPAATGSQRASHALPPAMTENTGMTNLGKVLLPPNVPAQYSAAFDSTTGFGYFGATSAMDPSMVSKVNLNGRLPLVVQDAQPNSIPKGVINILALAIDTTNPDPLKHYLYAGASTGQILKLSPGDATHTPQVMSILEPKSASGVVICGVMDVSSRDPEQHYIYYGVIGKERKARVLRVRLSDFSEQGVESLNVVSVRSCAIDTTHHYAYFTTFSHPSMPPQIAKVNLATFHDGGSSVATLSMDSTKPGEGIARAGFDYPSFDEGLVVDAVHGYAYIGTYNVTADPAKLDTWPYNQALVVRVKLGSGDTFPPRPLEVLNLRVEERDLGMAVMDQVHGNVYFGTDNTYPARVYMIHVGNGKTPMKEVGRLDLYGGTQASSPRDGDNTKPQVSAELNGEVHIRSGILDAKHNAIYFATDSRPGQVIKVGINGGKR